jgi:branched-chain amino acid aminotransferase
MPQKAAVKLGYASNLWLHGPEHYLTEVSVICPFLNLQRDLLNG